MVDPLRNPPEREEPRGPPGTAYGRRVREGRECYCLICVGGGPRGWSAEDTPADGARSGFSFTVGLWHHFASPEVAIFGLDAPARMRYLARVGEAALDGRLVVPDQCQDDILGDRVVVPRPALASWHRHVFAAVLDFYRGQPVPVVQLVWADHAGRYPWVPDCDPGCAHSQPRLWDRARTQPVWATAPDPPGWAFAVPPDTVASASAPVAYGGAAATAVIHDEDGEWEFLGAGEDGSDLTVVHLAHLVARQPDLAALADLPAGWEAQRIAPGAWQRLPLEDD